MADAPHLKCCELCAREGSTPSLDIPAIDEDNAWPYKAKGVGERTHPLESQLV